MTFNPYNCETYDTIISDLCKNSDMDIVEFRRLIERLLRCSYYDIDNDMYVIVRDKVSNVDPPTNDTFLRCTSQISVTSYEDKSVVFKASTPTEINDVNGEKIRYCSTPLILTVHPIMYHMYNIDKNGAQLIIRFKDMAR